MPQPGVVDIIIPEEFLAKLRQDTELLGDVLKAVTTWLPYIRENKLPLFPGFTDHGLQHINEVLATADLFVAELAAAKLSPRDVAALVLSVTLHDIAMHLSIAGLRLLVDTQMRAFPRRARSCFPNEASWRDMWNEHLSHVRRWSRQQLQDVVGRDTYPGDPPEDSVDWTMAHRLIAGDFVRRHHARMAWEFAWTGFPGVAQFVEALSGVDEDVCLVASLVARSHGVSHRVGSSWFGEDRYRRRYRGMHPTYLMAVLRLADRIQIHKARAHPAIPLLREIVSATSGDEWQKHGATFFDMQVRADVEALEVEVEPDNVHTFLALRDLLNDIQAEMDSTWAVLGEVYGRFDEMPKTLRFRRIKSNLEDEARFSASVEYVPERICLCPSPRLLPNLVGPLYSHNPAFGYRELLQNAVDAVRERAFLEPEGGYGVEVSLHTQPGSAKLVVADQGVGMIVETLRAYYLNVGSSICMSTKWQVQFEESGLLRVGRFGIGALASFLLADTVRVTTRHIAAEDGLQFSYSLDSGNIEVCRVVGIDIGTEIEIGPLSSDTVDVLRSAIGSWYSSDQPEVRVSIDGEAVAGAVANHGRSCRIESRLGLDISAVVDERRTLPTQDDRCATYVNGFRIGEPDRSHDSSQRELWNSLGFCFDLHIRDPNHEAPINLIRTELEYEFLEDEEAMCSLFELLRELWEIGPRLGEWVKQARIGTFSPERWERGLHLNEFAYYQGGLFPDIRGLLCQLAGGKVYEVELRGERNSPMEWVPHLDAPVCIRPGNPSAYNNLMPYDEEARHSLKGVYASHPPPTPIGMLCIGLGTEVEGRLVKRASDPHPPPIPEQLGHRDIAGWSINLYRADEVLEPPFVGWWLNAFPNGLPVAP